MTPSSVETLSPYHCTLKDSGLCTLSNNNTCSQNLPKCDREDECPDSSTPSAISESYSYNAMVTGLSVILTLILLVIVGYISLLAWTYIQNTYIEPKILTFEVYDPFDLPETLPKYIIID
jgi:hypothetical protein